MGIIPQGHCSSSMLAFLYKYLNYESQSINQSMNLSVNNFYSHFSSSGGVTGDASVVSRSRARFHRSSSTNCTYDVGATESAG